MGRGGRLPGIGTGLAILGGPGIPPGGIIPGRGGGIPIGGGGITIPRGGNKINQLAVN